MEAKELRDLADSLASLQDKDGGYVSLRRQVARVVSHIESQMRVEQERDKHVTLLAGMLERHDKVLFGDPTDLSKNPGIVRDAIQVKEHIVANKRRMNAAIIGLGGLLGKALFDLVVHGKVGP